MGGGMTDQIFALPDLGEGLTEAEIVEWRVAVGDTVEVDQIVVEVETAKAVVDVPCPYAGRVAALHGAPGQRRPVGQPLVTIEPLAAEPSEHAVYREEERAGSGNVLSGNVLSGNGLSGNVLSGNVLSGNVLIGYGTGHGGSGRRRRRVLPAGDPAPVAVVPTAVAEPAAPVPVVEPVTRVISPLVRRLARDHGIDVGALRGSGPGGIVRRADVETALVSTAPAEQPASGDDIVIALTGVRRAIAEKLSRSRREIPEVTIWVDVDATGLLDTRAAINAARPDQPVSVLALLARICVSALQRYPELNSRVDSERGKIVQSSRINLGVAAQTDRGLVVPVIHDAQRLTTFDLAAALSETTAQARAGTLPPARMTGGTFTLNNYGVFGVDGSTPIINHPEAALLGIGRIVDKPWVVDGQLAVRKVGQVSLTFDHRVCDGGTAGGFLRHVADCIEQPALLIAHA
jgi:2-oxoisovalerate dehydrogenase E2 component (dihydrolipoyl transacylase)